MAESLTRKYPTPAALMEAYDACGRGGGGEGARGAMLAGFEYGPVGGRKVNKGVSEAVAALYNHRDQME